MNKILSCFLLISLGACAMTTEENAPSVAASDTQTPTQPQTQTASDVAVAQVASASEPQQNPPEKKPSSAILAEDVTVLPKKNDWVLANAKNAPQNTSTPNAEAVDKMKIDKSDKSDKKNQQHQQQQKDKTQLSDKADKADKNSPPKLNVTLRKQAEMADKADKNSPKNKGKKKIVIPAPKVVVLPKAAPPKPVLTRRQILENEIKREQTALKSAQNQLAQAQKAGNQNAIKRLNHTIHDREQNIQSLKKELVR